MNAQSGSQFFFCEYFCFTVAAGELATGDGVAKDNNRLSLAKESSNYCLHKDGRRQSYNNNTSDFMRANKAQS